MISEPEVAGEFGGAEPREVIGDFDQEPAGRRIPRTRWVWALGGVVVASAVWVAALPLLGALDRKPDMHGYALDQDLCRSLQLRSIGGAIAPRETTPMTDSGLLEHPALDQIQCLISLGSPTSGDADGGGWSIHYTVGLDVALHKKADPAVEFEARRRVTDLGVVPEELVETIPDLGDEAYLVTPDAGSSELRVVEGGAVLSLQLSASTQYQGADDNDEVVGEGPDTPDVSQYRSALIGDMRDLMSRLKR
ncbi:hypothetical protein ACFWU3_06305 [Streptomyces sp. NPDC058685]|uniref:hypothetical protein n=1 Tax=Streptomyces sp. NPDC058685 TaxID=3346598 RepID=UPI003663C10D